MNTSIIMTVLVSGALVMAPLVSRSEPAATVTAEAALLHVPSVDYRRDWVLLGSFSILADEPEEGAKQLHVVYAQREAVDAYLQTNAFPDGAVLVKDVFATRTEQLTTGTSSYAGTLVGRFIMVKDGAGLRADTSLFWGDGWGWAFYEGNETRQTVTTDYREDCLACHEPARSQDLIHIQGYPVLKR